MGAGADGEGAELCEWWSVKWSIANREAHVRQDMGAIIGPSMAHPCHFRDPNFANGSSGLLRLMLHRSLISLVCTLSI